MGWSAAFTLERQGVEGIRIGNNGPGDGLGAQVTNLTVIQTSAAQGSPIVTTPIPVMAGDIGPHATATVNVTIDFTGCASNALFTADGDSVG